MVLLLCCATLCADDYEILRSSEVHQGDYFAAGKSVEIAGRVTGDVYVTGGQVRVDGEIDGDLLVLGGSLNVTGRVSGSVRVVGGQVMLSGDVGRNLTLLAGNGEFLPSGRVQGNLFAIVGNLDTGIPVEGQARIYASNLRLYGPIKGNLNAYVGQMYITSKGRVGGMLDFWSNNEAMISPDAKIGGFEHHPSLFYRLMHGKFLTGIRIGSRLVAKFMNLLYTFIIGLILMAYFPRRIWGAVEAVGSRPIQALISGVVVAIVLPIAALALLVTILGAPFALTLIAMNAFVFYTAKIVCILYVVRRIDPSLHHKKRYFLTGLVLYSALTLIPFFGWILSLAALFMGLGALIVAKNGKEALH